MIARVLAALRFLVDVVMVPVAVLVAAMLTVVVVAGRLLVLALMSALPAHAPAGHRPR